MSIRNLLTDRAQKAIFLAKLFKANGLKAVLRHRNESNAAHIEVLCTSPNVLLTTANRPRDDIHFRLQKIDVLFLLRFSWAILDVSEIDELVKKLKAEILQFPRHQFMVLCNEEWQVTHFEASGIEAVFVNSNSFVNETCFSPVINENIQYAAVYNAAMAPYKRYELSINLPSIMAITYKYSGTYLTDYEDKIRSLLPQAYWVNDEIAKGEKISVNILPTLYAKCGVGLCLSEVEGAMFASIEYLLCGLPIVSTYSRGGRDVFFDERFVRVADPNPVSVAEAVNELISKNIDRQMIRDETIKKILIHRERFAKALIKYGATVKVPWEPGSHGAVTARKYSEVEKLVRSGSTSI